MALLGGGTALHAMFGPAFRHLEGARLVAVMDPWPEARVAAERAYGVRTYATLRGLLRHARPHVAVVASPTPAHAPQVRELAAAGVHVLCEKPMARCMEEAESMIAACRDAGVRLGLGFMKRFNASLALATDWVLAGKLGQLYQVDCEWSFPAGHPPERYGHPHKDWRGHIENWGGVLQDHGSHTFDLCLGWLGPAREVSAAVRALHPEVPVEDVATVLCRHHGGGTSTHRMNIRTHKPLLERYELFGTEGTLEVWWGGVWRWSAYTAEPMNVLLHRRGRETLDLTPRPEQAPDLQMAGSWHYLRELQAFLSAVREQGDPPVGGVAGRAAVELITAAYQSSATRQTVGLPLAPPYIDLEPLFHTGAFRG